MRFAFLHAISRDHQVPVAIAAVASTSPANRKTRCVTVVPSQPREANHAVATKSDMRVEPRFQAIQRANENQYDAEQRARGQERPADASERRIHSQQPEEKGKQ